MRSAWPALRPGGCGQRNCTNTARPGKFPVFLAIGALSRVNGNKASTGCRPFHPEEPAPVPRFWGRADCSRLAGGNGQARASRPTGQTTVAQPTDNTPYPRCACPRTTEAPEGAQGARASTLARQPTAAPASRCVGWRGRRLPRPGSRSGPRQHLDADGARLLTCPRTDDRVVLTPLGPARPERADGRGGSAGRCDSDGNVRAGVEYLRERSVAHSKQPRPRSAHGRHRGRWRRPPLSVVLDPAERAVGPGRSRMALRRSDRLQRHGFSRYSTARPMSLRLPAGQARDTPGKDTAMSELLVDFITSLDGHASGEGWPGFWGLEGPGTSHGSASSPGPPT